MLLHKFQQNVIGLRETMVSPERPRPLTGGHEASMNDLWYGLVSNPRLPDPAYDRRFSDRWLQILEVTKKASARLGENFTPNAFYVVFLSFIFSRNVQFYAVGYPLKVYGKNFILWFYLSISKRPFKMDANCRRFCCLSKSDHYKNSNRKFSRASFASTGKLE